MIPSSFCLGVFLVVLMRARVMDLCITLMCEVCIVGGNGRFFSPLLLYFFFCRDVLRVCQM